jgi:alpha-glucosidase
VPHEIIFDLGNSHTINGFSYLARQDGGVNGRVKDFEIYLSENQAAWGEPALKGTLQNSINEQRLLFPQTATGRYLKFKALSEVNGNIWTSVAELGILPTGKSK